TLTNIAAEKAGIIKEGTPVITGTEESEALKVIEEAARKANAPLTKVTLAAADTPPLEKLELPLRGRHQRLNAAVALATIKALKDDLPVMDEQIVSGLRQVNWPGRLQLLERPSGHKIFLDGAHNFAAAEALNFTLRAQFPAVKWAVILGVLQDKDWRGICQ